MTKRFEVARASTAVALSILLLFASARGLSQAPPDAQAQAAANAALAKANFERTASTLTVYDRRGQVVRTVGERALYRDPVFSPDRTRLAVAKIDLESDTEDIWVLDVATGDSTRITSNQTLDRTRWPVWSPDGSQVAYVRRRDGSFGLYRKASNGEGTEGLLYQHATGPTLTDWSPDGRFLTFHDAASLYILPLNAAGPADRKAIELVSGEFRAGAGRFSPDSRFLSYSSDQSGKWEVYVRPFDPSAADGVAPAAGPWQVSEQGGLCTCAWRQDGKEFYYLTPDGGVMAVEVSTAPAFKFEKPRLLFKGPDTITQNPLSKTAVSSDGQQVLFTVPPKPRGSRFPTQLTVFDRQGNVVRTLGEPGVGYTEPALSPDGTHVAATRNGQIQMFDVSTGNSVPLTASAPTTRYQGAAVWSPDGRQLVSFSQREQWSGLYRQASDGSGRDELLYRETFEICLPLTDWSPDGRFLSFGGGGVLWTVPVNGERQASEFLREEFVTLGARFSPDSRYVAYVSNESDRYEIYVRPFDPSTGAAGGEKWQISTQGGLGLIQWRGDGRELYYLARDGAVMAVDVATSPTFQAGPPTLLFRAPATVGGLLDGATHADTTACGTPNGGCGEREPGSISRDGQRFVFAAPLPPPEVTLARGILERYIGTWRQPGGGIRLVGNTVVVTLEGNQLMIQMEGRKAALFAESETKFFLMSNGDFEFVSDDKGDVKYLFVYQGGAPAQLIRQ